MANSSCTSNTSCRTSTLMACQQGRRRRVQQPASRGGAARAGRRRGGQRRARPQQGATRSTQPQVSCAAAPPAAQGAIYAPRPATAAAPPCRSHPTGWWRPRRWRAPAAGGWTGAAAQQALAAGLTKARAWPRATQLGHGHSDEDGKSSAHLAALEVGRHLLVGDVICRRRRPAPTSRQHPHHACHVCCIAQWQAAMATHPQGECTRYSLRRCPPSTSIHRRPHPAAG